MNKEQFYSKDDLPSGAERAAMWKRIQSRIGHGPLFNIPDRRSFFYGIAAAFVLAFSGFGLYTLVDRIITPEQPVELRFDQAYRSAIQEFESVLPALGRVRDTEVERDMLQTRRQQIDLIDSAIRELREDIARSDLSPLKRSRLRQLYTLKLQVLLEIIEQGEIEL